MNPMAHKYGLRQRGIAALTAILVVALASILAVELAWEVNLDIRRTENMLLRDQARQIALGAEIMAIDELRIHIHTVKIPCPHDIPMRRQ